MALNPNCTLIGVIGGKGGVGKSIFAANFSLALMNELRTQVLLIDGDSKSIGDQNFLLGQKPVKTLREIANLNTGLSSTPLNQLVNTHPSGLAYLGAVRGPEEKLDVNPEALMRQIEFFSRQFKFIVVDLGNDIGPLQNAFLLEATACYIITTPEVLVVAQTQRLVNDMLSATFPRDMFQLVINKVSPSGISPQDISNSLRLPPMGLIPQDEITSQASIQKQTPFVISQPKAPITNSYYDIVRRITGGTLQRLKGLAKPKPVAASVESSGGAGAGLSAAALQGLDPQVQMRLRVHSELLRLPELSRMMKDFTADESKQNEIKDRIKREITQIVDREAPELARDKRQVLIEDVLKEALGLGPLEDLLADKDISEIMINGYKKIFVEKGGKLTWAKEMQFTSNDHLRRIIERIVTPLGRQINNASPMVDARLKDGSRVNAIIEPCSIDGPAVTIRKFKKGGVSPEKYVDYGSMTKNMIDFLRICVENGMNVVISGGTGSGKTTLLNMLSSFIPVSDRIVTVEDAAELQMQQDHVVRLETRPTSMEGSHAITIRDLIKNALRMRPDRIVVGECRDGAALDMLQAMNTGHDGSMTTTHANNAKECISRLETLCMMAGMDLPVRAIREQIASAVHIIVQVSRLSDGSRKIMSITEVDGIQGEAVTLAPIFIFKETGYDAKKKILGQFQPTGYIPKLIQKLAAKNVIVPKELFLADSVKAAASTTGPSANPQTPAKKIG
ncbi:MAG: Flp pilus assembly complex ATPase component TadA [Bdellovibrionaceae bacterium]|nr:Flp pilus assembly complex ATPase component TadA [Pseudobdellovibrionaceae bacterium]